MQHRATHLACLLVLLVLVLASLIPGGTSLAQTDAPPPPVDEARSEGLFDGVVVVRVYYNTLDDIQLLAEYDVFEYNNLEERYVLAAVDRAELQSLRDLGFRLIIDLEETASFARLSIPLAEQPQEAIGPESIPSYSCYRTVEETYASAAALAAAHPTLATWSDVGNSWEKATVTSPDLAGYDMMLLKLTNSAVGGSKPKLFITASIHAREYAPAELTTRFAEHLVNNYGTDADATWLLDHHEIHLMFQANPDGRKKAEAGSSWRKNTDRDDGCTSTYGADLNRNFSYQWGTGGSSSVACNETYRGPGAGSEPETQVIQNYLLANFPDQRGSGTAAAPADATGIYLDIHSYGGYVMWPWGYTSTTPPNATQLQTLGRKVAFFNSYSPGQITHLLYVASGGSVDYAYGELGVASLAIEVGTAFFQSCSSFTGTVLPANLPALVYAAKVARTPYQTPLGPDALSLALSPASVAKGNAATLTATINDTRYRSGSGEATQNIAAAEYYLDTPPWQGGTASAMTASDGAFNATVENVTATVDTTGLAEGRHILFVRGQDASGNWGAFSAIFLTVTPCIAPASVGGLAIARLNNSQVEVSWTAAADAHHYEVWSASNDPYFMPGSDCSNPAPYACTSVPSVSFTDAPLGSPTTHTVYVVRAASSCGAVSAPGSGRAGEFEYDLLRGN